MINFGPYSQPSIPYPYNYTGTNTGYSGQGLNTTIQPMNNVVIGVQGIDAAKAYPLAPNTRGYFLDTEEDFIYIKEIDPDGVQRKSLRILKCKEITEDDLKVKEAESVAVQIPNNVVTTDILDQYLEKYLNEHSYRPYIPRAKKEG